MRSISSRGAVSSEPMSIPGGSLANARDEPSTASKNIGPIWPPAIGVYSLRRLRGLKNSQAQGERMNTANRWSVLVVGCVVWMSAGRAGAQDWPQWRGPNRDGKAAGFTAPADWPKELTQKWKVTVGDGVATPALVGERLYVFSRQEGNEITRCL